MGKLMPQGAAPADIVAEELLRADTCRKFVQALLEKYNCTMEPIFHINRHGVKGEIQFIANPRIPKNGG